MLALAAALYGVFNEHSSELVKGLWVTAFGLLAAAEIGAIRREHIKQNAAYLEQMRTMDEMRQTANSKHEAVIRLLLAINDPVEGLKKRALQLSESLLAFVYDQLQHAPKWQQPSLASWQPPSVFATAWEGGFQQAWQETQKMIEYQKNTLSMYADRFSKRVGQIRDELSKQGLTDDQLDLTLSAPKSPQDIRLIAERIGGLAEKLEVAPQAANTNK
jgi:hypothetical protein